MNESTNCAVGGIFKAHEYVSLLHIAFSAKRFRQVMKTRKSLSPGKVSSVGQGTRKAKPLSGPVYPFSQIVGQEEMKLALVLNVIDPLIGGVLIMGHRGTGKSTAVRGLADLLPEMTIVTDCVYRCDPQDLEHLCNECVERLNASGKLQKARVPVRVVDLPLGATEDRVCGTIDIERALQTGAKGFEPGLLARANRGFLYIDEVNLLEDHLVDILLDAATTGRNKVERESISIEHPARFVLIGSGNPEEGELRPQLQDRFGFNVEVITDNNLDSRVAVVEKREAFERDPDKFSQDAKAEQDRLRSKITKAKSKLPSVRLDRSFLRLIAQLCSHLKIDGHRGELTIARGARALAAFDSRNRVTSEDIKRVAVISLRHRLRRDALDETPSSEQINDALDRIFAATTFDGEGNPRDGDGSIDHEESTDRRDVITHPNSRAVNARSARSTDPDGGEGADGVLRLAGTPDTRFRVSSLKTARPSTPHPVRHSTRQRAEKFKMANPERGRYTRAVNYRTTRLAVDATLRAVAGARHPGIGPTLIPLNALRYKIFARKSGRLFIFAIDTSGSMALNRINQAKGALLKLLRKSYIERDRVAIVAFGGTRAHVLLPPSRSVLRARRVLDSLSVGGGTPLSAGVACSLKLAGSAQENSSTVLLLFTDGNANVPLRNNVSIDRAERRLLIDQELKFLGVELQRARVTTVVVETRNRFAAGSEVRALAAVLQAQAVEVVSDPISKFKT